MARRSAAAAAAAAESFNTGKAELSGMAKYVRVHVGGNHFLVYSRFCNRLPSAASGEINGE